MIILGIETSCDDTAVSVIEKRGSTLFSRSHIQYSQIKTHAKYGGVIPEVAAREHAVTIIPTLQEGLCAAKVTLKKIDCIAVTQGPGLAPALAIGLDTAVILSRMFRIPVVGINHIEGHMASVWPIRRLFGAHTTAPRFPALGLIVSGGHTELQLIKKFGSYKLLGKTRDDAVGEAFDKVASLFGLTYPGGPKISALAKRGNVRAYDFPRPMMKDATLDFSYAGLKTAVRYTVDKLRLNKKMIPDLAASFEQAAIDVLVVKTIRALKQTNAKSLVVVGGVSANEKLRSTLSEKMQKIHIPLLLAPLKLTTDNATMIAMAAALRKKRIIKKVVKKLDPKPRWELGR